jgi:hypothetical protein
MKVNKLKQILSEQIKELSDSRLESLYSKFLEEHYDEESFLRFVFRSAAEYWWS